MLFCTMTTLCKVCSVCVCDPLAYIIMYVGTLSLWLCVSFDLIFLASLLPYCPFTPYNCTRVRVFPSSLYNTCHVPLIQLDQVKVQREADGNSKGYGFVEFKSPEVADNAMKHLNGFELANQPIRVNYVNERTADMESLDTQDMDVGVGMTATSRASLMAKLSEGHKAGVCVCVCACVRVCVT